MKWTCLTLLFALTLASSALGNESAPVASQPDVANSVAAPASDALDSVNSQACNLIDWGHLNGSIVWSGGFGFLTGTLTTQQGLSYGTVSMVLFPNGRIFGSTTNPVGTSHLLIGGYRGAHGVARATYSPSPLPGDLYHTFEIRLLSGNAVDGGWRLCQL